MSSFYNFVTKDTIKAPKPEAIALVRKAFSDPRISDCIDEIYPVDESSQIEIFGIEDSHARLLAFAAARETLLRINGTLIRSASIGMVSVLNEKQSEGLGSLLVRQIIEFAKLQRYSFLYLQGIPNFYLQFGFTSIINRSRVTIAIEDLMDNRSVELRPLTYEDLPFIQKMYSNLSHVLDFSAIRSAQEWAWLLSRAKNTFLFYRPTGVYLNDKCVGYFTSDPLEPARIREAVYDVRVESVSAFFSGLMLYAQDNELTSLEVMTWRESPIVNFLKEHTNFTLSVMYQRTRGQMGLSLDSSLEQLQNSIKHSMAESDLQKSRFIFQGDNL